VETSTTRDTQGWSTTGLALGALGILAAVWAYWLILPGIVFGIAAIALGILGRKRSSTDASSVAIALGIVALILVPSVLIVVDDAEDWGRDCALYPTNPDC
jgi:amino acid transporter